MTEERQGASIVKAKRGIPVYRSNPSVPSPEEIKKSKRVKIGDEQRGLVVDNGTGEILGHGGALVYEWKDVDKEKFVKLYLEGIKQAVGMSKAGLSVFEIVYKQLQEKPGGDEVMLSASASGLEERTYQRGLRELLEREFLFRSHYDGMFFVNIRYIFNGDRLAFVKGYRIKDLTGQRQLPLGDPPALAPPRDGRE